MQTLRPLGAPVPGWHARPLPGPGPLVGRFGRLRRLRAADAADIWAAGADRAEIWDYLASGPFKGPAEFAAEVARLAPLSDPCFYAVLDPAGRALGWASLMSLRPGDGVIEIGWILYTPALQRTALGTEAQALLMAHALDDLGYRRLEWKCNALNAPSRAAAERLGYRFEGVFRQHMVVKGRNRDTAWYAITDAEWPGVRAGLAAWLAPDNFGADGAPRRRLADLRAAVASQAEAP